MVEWNDASCAGRGAPASVQRPSGGGALRSDEQAPGRDAVLVTGASSGIGRACVDHLARLGLRVFSGVRRESDVEALRQTGSGIEPVFLDVTDPAQIEAARRRIELEVTPRGLLGLVNNAGIATAAPVEFVEMDALRRQLEVNLVGSVAVTQTFLPLLRRRRGRIALVGSSQGYLSLPFLGAYCASKFAMEGLADALRMELRPWGIEVALIEPGSIATPIWSKATRDSAAAAERLPPQARERYAAHGAAMLRDVARQETEASPPEVVARAVAHALTASRPRTRYVVGSGARLEWLMARFLPDRLRDAVLARILGLPRRRETASDPDPSG
jgi:NAD(P)-dependent dehydrogenase (short-subunit alcohol dehydrogenase family)